jgi:hypothetical protein
MEVYVRGVGILAPGLCGWAASRAVLAGGTAFSSAETPKPRAAILPANEQRRASDSVKWALEAALEAIENAGVAPAAVATVFSSSGGETAVFDRICSALASDDRAVSPTLFHHSVHNAAAGYWGIGTQSRLSSTALAGYDASFAAGLLEAVSLVRSEVIPVLLVAYDLPAPPPMYAARPLRAGCACALVLSSEPGRHSLARLSVDLIAAGKPSVTVCADPGLEDLRTGNPAARGLPLLAGIARGASEQVQLEYLHPLSVQVSTRPVNKI